MRHHYVRPVQLLGDICTLAVSNTLIIFGNQTNHLFAQKGNEEVRFTGSSESLYRYSGISAVGVVCSHPETQQP